MGICIPVRQLLPKRVLLFSTHEKNPTKRGKKLSLHLDRYIYIMVEETDILFPISKPVEVSEAEYRSAQAKMDVVEAFARITTQGVFVADLSRNRFLYVSDSPLVLFGHPAEEVMAGGYSFLIDQAAPEDRPLMAELVEAVGHTHYWPKDDGNSTVSISCNFHFLGNGHPVLVNHKVTPLARTAEGQVWLALCLVAPSVHSDTGHIEATVSSPSGISIYAFENHQWSEKRHQLELSDGERTMLHLSAQGYTMSQIGEKMFRSVDTVKLYRRHVFDKLGVSNISEAIAYAFNYNLL